MSSTTGRRSDDLLNEIARQRALRIKAERRTREHKLRAEKWKQRAQAAEWALRNKRKAA